MKNLLLAAAVLAIAATAQGQKITELPELAEPPTAEDMIPIVDTSDTTEAATGTTKKVGIGYILDAPHTTLNFTQSSISETEISEGVIGLSVPPLATNLVYSTDGTFSGGVAAGNIISGDGTFSGMLSVQDFQINGVALGTAAFVNANTLQPASTLLNSISGLGTNGLMARTSATTAASRTITGTSGQIGVSNGDGQAGNPVISLANPITLASPQFNPASTPVIFGAGGFTGTPGTASIEFDNNTTTTGKLLWYHANVSNVGIQSLPSPTFTNAQTSGQRLCFYRNLGETGATLGATMDLSGNWEFPVRAYFHGTPWINGTNFAELEGSTIDGFEITLALSGNPTADATLTFPTAGGTVITSSTFGTQLDSSLTGTIIRGKLGTSALGNIVLNGRNSTASYLNTTVVGSDAADRIAGAIVHSAGGFLAPGGTGTGGSPGSAQTEQIVLQATTSDATPTAMVSVVGGTNNRIAVDQTNQLVQMEVTIVGLSTTGHRGVYKRRAIFHCSSGGVFSQVGTTEPVGTDFETNSAWDVSVTPDADDYVGDIVVTGTTGANGVIRWVSFVRTTEVHWN